MGVLPPSVLPRACGTGHWGSWGGGSCLESSRACASFCRMRERATQTWNTGGWLLALCLAWLWTRLASASLQPPTPTGLGEVVGPTPGGTWFFRMPGKLDTNHPTPFHSRQISEAEYNPQILGVLAPILHPGTLPSLLSQSEKAPADPFSSSLPGRKVFCRERSPRVRA